LATPSDTASEEPLPPEEKVKCSLQSAVGFNLGQQAIPKIQYIFFSYSNQPYAPIYTSPHIKGIFKTNLPAVDPFIVKV
jgi:hypothetical protein